MRLRYFKLLGTSSWVKYPLYAYCTGIGFGGVIGCFSGCKNGLKMIEHRKPIELSSSLKSYESLLNNMVYSGIVASHTAITGFTSMLIVAGFPISVPILLKYRIENAVP